jgi:hypothetical protein
MNFDLRCYCLAASFIIFLGCKPSKQDLYVELERFDNSLDSLIAEETSGEMDYLIFQGDTLRNSPTAIVETCYQVIGNDSIKVDANGHLYKFDKCHLLMNSSEDFLGNKFVQKYIYFEDKIDNEMMESLRKQKSDTIYFGRLRKYNANGHLVKSIESYESRGQKDDGSIIANDYRLLEIHRYNDDNSVTTWTKVYFNKKYSIDSLHNVKVRKSTFVRHNSWEEDKYQYSYDLDKYGNWTAKRRKREDPDVYYRKYTY